MNIKPKIIKQIPKIVSIKTPLSYFITDVYKQTKPDKIQSLPIILCNFEIIFLHLPFALPKPGNRNNNPNIVIII